MGKIPLFACVLIPMALEAQTVSPASAVFNYLVGSTLPATQSLSVKPAAGATSSTYVATAAPAHSWLIVTPGTGRLPGSLKLAVNPTSLTAGTYTGTVTITVSGAATSLTVNVTLNVTSDSPMLILSSTALSFTAPPVPTAQTVLVTATSGAIPFSATTGTSWLSVSAPQLLALPGQQIPLTVSVDPAALNPQATPYSGKITVTASGVPKSNATQTITVSLTVQTMTPAIASIWPSQLPVMASTGSTTAGQTITIHGTNFYSGSTVQIDGQKVQTIIFAGDSTVLEAVVPAAMLSSAGMLDVVVSNAAPGGDSVPATITVSDGPVIAAVENAASYGYNAQVSPGELVTLFGSNVGPNPPASLNVTSGYVDTTLGGVSVTVAGFAAPMIFASANQITFQVPYQVPLGAATLIVTNNGVASPQADVAVVAQAPGIFTLNGTGAGPAAAITVRASGSAAVNDKSNAAVAGDALEIFLTGEGEYASGIFPVETGFVVPIGIPATSLPSLMPAVPVEVTIGGKPATVTYAGPVPGSILGLLQVNVTVPSGAGIGQMDLTVSLGVAPGTAAQSGVKIWLK